jgi:molybdopterin/thiamine biosynthesis adenylyltransferase
VGEVFKRLVALRPGRGQLLDALAFDLRSYSIADFGADGGEPLEQLIALPDTVIVGVGAIGNGVAYLLSRLRLKGRVTVVDHQRFGDENLGTCILIGPADLDRPKAEVIAELLHGDGLEVKPVVGDVATFAAELAKPPRIVVVGVDSVDARHEAQELWPDLMIDGAIGAFVAQVGRHPWDEPVGCLRCVFRHPPGRAAEVVVSEATGLSVERARHADDQVTDGDVSAAPAEKQEWLRARIGRRICAVAAEVASISARPQAEGFAPSVPFVATMSGAMMVGELIKAAMGMASPLAPRYQFDLLQGPARGLHVPQVRRVDCKCVTRRKNIDAVRQGRLA